MAVGQRNAAPVVDFAVARYLSDGTLDSSFGSGGILRFDTGFSDSANEVVVDPNGKILFVGRGASIVRLNDDGAFDTSFGGGDGVVSGSFFEFLDVVLQDDGKIITSGRNGHAGVFRFNDDGSLDTTFGNVGGVSVDISGRGTDTARGVVLQSDGKIVIVGVAPNEDDPAPQNIIGLARFEGDIQPVSLGGTIFDDLDNDGVRDVGEFGIEGVTVTLTGTDVNGAVNRTTVTLTDGAYVFDNVFAGTYAITADQAIGLLDGRETAGSLGGTVDNTQDSQTITGITVVNGDADATGYNFAEIRQSDVSGIVWQDFNNDGEVNFGEQAIENVTLNLTGTDDRGNSISQSMQTDVDGAYMFIDLRPGDYTISEVQPAGLDDGLDVVGTVDGVPTGDNTVNDTISDVLLTLPGAIAVNYNFAERPVAGGEVVAGQTATIGFWQNKNGQALIEALNGGAASTQLGDWLAATLPNMYGSGAGANDLTGASNSDVADFYSDLFRRKKKEAVQLGLSGPVKTDAQVFATALAVYVTNSTLADNTAAGYGFLVTANGVGTSSFNVGDNGDAFDVADDSDVTILDLLLATNDKSFNGILYDLGGDGDADDSLETLLRSMANSVYSCINEQGDI